MTKIKNSKQYDLEERTLKFAKEVITFVKSLPRTIANVEIIKQLIRASSSVGANYIEANEALSNKYFVMRVALHLYSHLHFYSETCTFIQSRMEVPFGGECEWFAFKSFKSISKKNCFAFCLL